MNNRNQQNEKPVVSKAEELRLAKIGLIALIDEATGYQKERFKEAPTELKDMKADLDREAVEEN